MSIIIIGASIAAVVVAVIVIQNIRYKRAIDYRIRHSYGSSERIDRDAPDRLENIALLYEREKKLHSECDLVDGITWDDLDMQSVFLRANHTDSYAGEQCLYSSMHILGRRGDDTVLSSETADYYDKNDEKRNRVRKVLYSVGKPASAYYSIEVADDAESRILPHRFIYPLLLAVLIACPLLALIMKSPLFMLLGSGIYFTNLIIHMFLKSSFESKLDTLSAVGTTINAANSISAIVPELSGGVKESLRKLKRSSAILNILNLSRLMVDSGDTVLLLTYLIDPFMLDFIIYDFALSSFAKRKEEYAKVYRFVGETDCSIAIASYRRSLSSYCVPEISEGKRMSFKGIYHPLISSPVPNDITQERNIVLTGSNASGKSTFIKSVAINIILAQSVFTCTAESACVPECGVITSMAVRDDLASGESYYIREIKYLKRMTETVKQGRLLFLAIDEILKGTNTKERIAASKAVLRYFNDADCMLMVATHDVELAEAFDGIYENYYFCEQLDEGDIKFDYRLHKGICRSSNAIKLLSVIGFPEEITDAALAELC